METKIFLSLLEERIHQYDLLCHPFYKAWSAGELTRDDLRAYAEDYYPHVEAFPSYLAQLGVRLEEGELRRAVLANMTDEKGGEDSFGEPERSHAELWLDFVEGMGGSRIAKRRPTGEVRKLIAWFQQIASEGTPEEALAAFYAYESQVPRHGAGERSRPARTLRRRRKDPRLFHSARNGRCVSRAGVAHAAGEAGEGQSAKAAEKALAAAETRPKLCGRAGWFRGAAAGTDGGLSVKSELRSPIAERASPSRRGLNTSRPNEWPDPFPSACAARRLKPSS